jgi:hypothetical protein
MKNLNNIDPINLSILLNSKFNIIGDGFYKDVYLNNKKLFIYGSTGYLSVIDQQSFEIFKKNFKNINIESIERSNYILGEFLKLSQYPYKLRMPYKLNNSLNELSSYFLVKPIKRPKLQGYLNKLFHVKTLGNNFYLAPEIHLTIDYMTITFSQHFSSETIYFSLQNNNNNSHFDFSISIDNLSDIQEKIFNFFIAPYISIYYSDFIRCSKSEQKQYINLLKIIKT